MVVDEKKNITQTVQFYYLIPLVQVISLCRKRVKFHLQVFKLCH